MEFSSPIVMYEKATSVPAGWSLSTDERRDSDPARSPARLLQKAEEALRFFAEHAAELSDYPSFHQERRMIFEDLAKSARAAVQNPSLANEARRAAVFADRAEECACAYSIIALSSYLHRHGALDGMPDKAQRERLMSQARDAELFRDRALSILDKKDLEELRNAGLLRPGE